VWLLPALIPASLSIDAFEGADRDITFRMWNRDSTTKLLRLTVNFNFFSFLELSVTSSTGFDFTPSFLKES
jgi:hypothetical protein